MPPSKSKVYAGLSATDIKSVPLSALGPLTPRQAEVLGWIAGGKRNREIAKLLRCSVRTVEKHVENIMETSVGIGAASRTSSTRSNCKSTAARVSSPPPSIPLPGTSTRSHSRPRP